MGQYTREEPRISWWTLLIVLEAHVMLSSTQSTTLSTVTRLSSSTPAISGTTTEETTQASGLTQSRPSPRDGDKSTIAGKTMVSDSNQLLWQGAKEKIPLKKWTLGLVHKNISDDDDNDSESFLVSSTDETVSGTNQLSLTENTNSFQDGTEVFSNLTNVIRDDGQIINTSSIINAKDFNESNHRNASASSLVPLLEPNCLNISKSRRDNVGNETYDNLKTNQSEDFRIVCPEQSLQNTTKNRTDSGANPSGIFDEILGSVVLASVGFVVMMLNGLVVTTCMDRNLRKNTYLNLVLGLSVNDFILGLTTFTYGIQLIFRLVGSLELCIIMTVMALSCLTISVYQSLCISLHRFLVVTNSEWSNILFKGKRKYLTCLTGWIVIAGSFASLVSPTNYDNNLCYHAVVYGGTLEISNWFYTILMASLMFGTMFFYCLAMYSLKVRYLSMSKDFLKSTNSHKKNDKGHSTSRKIINSMKMVSILLFTLYLFSGPLAVLTMLNISHDENKEIFFIAFSFAVLNSLINPIIYYFNIEEFQQALRSLFCNAPKEDINTKTKSNSI